MKILNFGSCNIDCVYTVDSIVSPSETVAASELSVYAGGKGLNQSIAASRAGADVFHAGCVGSDGAMLTDLMNSSGVDTSYIKTVGEKTGHAIIQVDRKGENSIVLYSGANAAVTRDYADAVLSHFDSGDILMLQNEISEVFYIVDRAFEKEMVTVFNPSPFTKELKRIDLNKISYLVLNEIEAASFIGCDEPEEFIKYIKSHYPRLRVILTLGSRGCIYFDGECTLTQPAYSVSVEDTTAAGDTFTGFFAACISKGMSVENALKYCSAASALAVSAKGAAPSIPMFDKVKSALETLRPICRDASQERQDAALRYIQGSPESATLDGLASSLGYSKSYIGRWLRENTGKSFSALLAEARCRRAAEHLEATDMPIGEIIGLSGYKNESFFRNAFVKMYGCTFSEYRKNKRGKR